MLSPNDPSVNPVADALMRVYQRVQNENDPLHKSACQSYQAWLGFYNGWLRKLGWNKQQLVEQANFYAQCIGCPYPPRLERKTVGKMGLKGVPGLNIA